MLPLISPVLSGVFCFVCRENRLLFYPKRQGGGPHTFSLYHSKENHQKELTNAADYDMIIVNHSKRNERDSRHAWMRREGAVGVSSCEGSMEGSL